MKRTFHALLLALVAILIVWILGERVTRGQAIVTGSAEIRNVGYVYVNCEDPTCSQSPGPGTLVDVPGGAVTFSLPGGPPRRVLVSFEARWGGGSSTSYGSTALTGLAVDGVLQTPPSIAVFRTTPDPRIETHGWQWITTPLSPGSHTAQLRWGNLGTPTSGLINLFDVGMAVFYR